MSSTITTTIPSLSVEPAMNVFDHNNQLEDNHSNTNASSPTNLIHALDSQSSDPLLDEHNHIDPSHQVTGKISGRYTQLRKQLRQCNHFSENYFVLEVNPHSSKQPQRKSSKKRTQKSTANKSCANTTKKVKREEPTTERLSTSLPPSTSSSPQIQSSSINNPHKNSSSSTESSSSSDTCSPTSLFVNPFSVLANSTVDQQAQIMKALEQVFLQGLLTNANQAAALFQIPIEPQVENMNLFGTTSVASPVVSTDQFSNMSDFCDMNFDLL
ncbi:hypothetical protein C9374_010828 [Naegleria lovaniensis]|uniref:Uncharacterized protein n=1 Tax=Naegleria lovaniensis TaxID=51637 RepID=A0AA88GFI7_NAELO|nr:uncharacterized protein C9374_010828 [Naegleria lovaniensis]KAG2374258.1 hypothetical protein C9374_010828 [Naegleria lovaniensis]